jgi:hypothetical protein
MTTPRMVPNQQAGGTGLGEDAAPACAPVEFRCDMCGETFEGRPEGAGLFVWTRGEETRFEEPPLCERCAAKVTVGALTKWAWEDEAEE